jgi:hypothetical protein
MDREVAGEELVRRTEVEEMPEDVGDEGEDIRAADAMVRSVAVEWARAFALGGLALPWRLSHAA